MTDRDRTHPASTDLDVPRARFMVDLGERLASLRQGLARMASSPAPTTELNAVRRRLHALAAAAGVLQFERAAEALALAEAALSATAEHGPSTAARQHVGWLLDLLPTVVLDDSTPLPDELTRKAQALSDPLCVVVYGDAALARLLETAGPLHSASIVQVTDPAAVPDRVREMSPDAVLLNGDDPHALELVPRIRQAQTSPRMPLVAVGNFERHVALRRLIGRGVERVLPRPVDAATLQRTLRQVCRAGPAAVPGVESPTEPAPRLRPAEFARWIGEEAERAFSHPHDGELSQALDFGSASELRSALWGAFARIRQLAEQQGSGASAPLGFGPNGCIAVAPDVQAAPLPPAASTAIDGVRLAGRQVVVAAADPALRQALCRSLEQLGAATLPADSAHHAAELTCQHWPDAIVSDTRLPDADGFQLCRVIKSDMAFSDVPVLVITWKEQLMGLLTSRRGEAAFDAAAPTLSPLSIASPLCRSLLARVQLEERLSHLDSVFGRLDGISPRLLLQLVCSRSANATLTLSSGELRYEIGVADGRPLYARLFERDRARSRGTPALGPLLGTTTGRFVVQRGVARSDADFSGDLMSVVDSTLARVREARELIAAGSLQRIERVVLNPLAVEPLRNLSTGPERTLITQLTDGTPPRLLLPSGIAGHSAGRLERVLDALARRGAVVALLDRDGQDLLSADPHGGSTPPTPVEPGVSPPHPQARSVNAPEAPTADVSLSTAVLRAVSEPFALADQPPASPADRPATHSAGSAPLPTAPARQDRPAPSGVPPSEVAPPLAAAAPTPSATDSHSDHSDHSPEDSPPQAASAPNTETRKSSPPAAPSPPLDRQPQVLDDEAFDGEAFDDEAFDDEAPLVATRVRSAAGPLAVTLAAAALAYGGVTFLADGGWKALTTALSAGPVAADAEPPKTSEVAKDAGPDPAARSDESSDESSDELSPTSEHKVPLGVSFTETSLPLLPQARVPPGHGLLEVRTWERQHIYVDGVFMGNYKNRLVPLAPGNYQLRLIDGSLSLARPFSVKANLTTRLVATPKNAE